MSGREVKIFDCPAERFRLPELAERLSEFNPRLVGIVANSVLISRAIEVSRLIKKIDPEIATVLGGYHPTLFPKTILREESVDFVAIGEGEMTTLDLCGTLEENGSPSEIKGVGFKEDGIRINPLRPVIKDLDKLPSPAYHLLPIKRYRLCSTSKRSHRQISVVSSRGCPFNCYFCSSPGFWGARYRSHSPEYVLAILDRLFDDYGIEEFQFKDDTFTQDRDRVFAICDLINRNRRRFFWSCYATFHSLERELMERMKEAGCYQLHIGVESGSDEILRKYKRTTKAKIYKVVDDAKKLGIELRLFFMVGPPDRREEDIEKTIQFAIDLDPDAIVANPSIPYPGSRFYSDLLENGHPVPEFEKRIYSDEMPVCDLPPFTRETLVRKTEEIYKRFYLRPAYLFRRIRAIRSLRDLKANLEGFISVIQCVARGRREAGLGRTAHQDGMQDGDHDMEK